MAWELTDNVRGPKGEKGDTGTFSSVTVSALPSDAAATVTTTGSPTDRHVHLGIPRGEKGDQGVAGTLSSASAESIPAGESAAVVMSGTTEVKHAHFKVPRGLPGVNAVENDEAVATYLGVTDSATTAAFYSRVQAGHLGIEKPNPQNGLIYIGSGTGTLTDNGVMGLKVKVDTPTGGRRDGIQANVKVTPGAAAGSVRGLLGRVDLADDTTTTGDTVAVWGDAWITAASSRNAWGGNIYGSIRPGVAYQGVMVGLEVGAENYGTTENNGGGLHVVGKSTGSKQAFGVMISSDPVADGVTGAVAGAFRTHLLMRSSVAPADNYIWIGPTGSGTNIPTGAPLFQINAAGSVGIGVIVGQDKLSVNGSIRFGGSGQAARLISGSGAPEGVVTASIGSMYVNVAGGASTTLYVKTSGTGNTGWTAK